MDDDGDVLSESSGDSDASDLFHLEVHAGMTWVTREDRDLQRLHELAARLRDRPLPPPCPDNAEKSWTDASSGVKLPIAHCAFRGCPWTGTNSDSVETHVCAQHAREIRASCGLASEGHFMAYYCGANAEIERRRMPSIGVSVDRRTFAHVVEVYNNGSVRNLVCFVCAQTKSATAGRNSAIE